jgi:uncharacterized membrane protein YozB (DUF420 family)
MYPAGTRGELAVANVAVNAVVDVKLTACTLILPPVIDTLLLFCVDIVPKPDTCVFAIAMLVLLAASTDLVHLQ